MINNSRSGKLFFEKHNTFAAGAAGAGGGSGWEMDLDPVALNDAAAKYEKASTDYNSALQTMIEAIKALDGAWEGSAKSDWDSVAGSLQTKLEAVGTTLAGNKSNVTQIAAKVSEIESDASSKIQAMSS